MAARLLCLPDGAGRDVHRHPGSGGDLESGLSGARRDTSERAVVFVQHTERGIETAGGGVGLREAPQHLERRWSGEFVRHGGAPGEDRVGAAEESVQPDPVGAEQDFGVAVDLAPTHRYAMSRRNALHTRGSAAVWWKSVESNAAVEGGGAPRRTVDVPRRRVQTSTATAGTFGGATKRLWPGENSWVA